ncbi:hypothetical protein J2754_001582 [Halarchaeum solikamskense]|uniref:hypothetical protein n=1 Tax=Halarchaeum nitratireducens TaxID=489913 RepID=UPI001B3ACB75|nr:hypothetical protein [Halarchaeum solikamskense]MBP2251261.1 hypothetical protein [Halarchaeum solikamskense]
MDEITNDLEEGDVVRIDFAGDYGTHEGEVIGITPGLGCDGQETEVDVKLENAGETDYAPSTDHYLIDIVTVTHNVDDELTASGSTIHEHTTESMGRVEEFEVLGE